MIPERADVVIVGGGPAGLSAALTFGRSRRKVVLFDSGQRRNERAEHLHGFVSRDGVVPAEFRAISREQLKPYDVTIVEAKVANITAGLNVTLEDGRSLKASRALLALGVIDVMPALPGFAELWGHSIFTCPYCHGFEVRDRAFGILASPEMPAEFAMMLAAWSRNLIVFSNGTTVSPETRATFAKLEIRLDDRKVVAVEPGMKVRFDEGDPVAIDVMFARPPQKQVPLIERMGLELVEGYVKVSDVGQTSLPGVFAAGDLTTPMQAAIVAAFAGANAAFLMNHALGMELLLGAPVETHMPKLPNAK